MRKVGYIVLLFAVVVTGKLSAQSVIDGIITDKEDKKIIGGAVVTILDQEGEMLAYGISRNDGTFSVKVNSTLAMFTVRVHLLGYEDYERRVENRSQSLNVELSIGEIQLREVVVKSQPMWNREDTLVYSVDVFKSLGDRTIGDVLKRLPGVEVSESGGIKYQGEPINKFYIEGLDLLENRYGIATNNVPVDAVQNVEVIENHEPLKMLKDISSSDKAAINLKLKKDKMNRPVGTISLGSGVSDEWHWLAEAFTLSAARNRQYIVMYKTNNAAKDIGGELTTQRLSAGELQDVSNYSPKTLLDARGFSYPPLEKKRYLFNNSHVASVNNLWRTGSNSQLRLNVQYLHDRQQETTHRDNFYFLPDSMMHIPEQSMVSQKHNMLDAALTYSDNSPGYYLNNRAKWTGHWDNSVASVRMNRLGVAQDFNLPSQQFTNDFKYVKRWGNKVWDITSFTAYASQPQRLTVNVDTTATDQVQQLHLSGFYTRNSTYYSLGRGYSGWILKVALEGASDRVKSELFHPVFTDSTRANITAEWLNLELIPTYSYRRGGLSINADVTLRHHTLRVKNKIYNSVDHHNYQFANPSLQINYRVTPMLTIRANYRYTQSIGDFQDLADIYFMSGYRSFSKRSGVLAKTARQSFGGGVQYRNPLTTFFFHTSLTYAPSRMNLVNSQRFVGTELVTGNRPYETKSDMLIWQGYAGKYLADIRTNVSLSASYNTLEGERLQQDVLYPYRFSGWSFLPKASVKISDDCSITYQAVLADRITEITRADDTFRSSMWQIAQQLSGFYLIGKQWQLNARVEHSYNEIGDDDAVKMFFADIGVTYKLKQLEFDFLWNNIFNQRSYSYSLYNGLDRFDYRYNLRSAMLMLTLSFKY